MKAYREPEDFWFKYSEPVEGTGGDDRKRYNWTKILSMLKVTTRVTDDAGVERARSKYRSAKEFAKHFSYRKGSKTLVLKKGATIARKLREIEEAPAFWDYADEIGEEDG